MSAATSQRKRRPRRVCRVCGIEKRDTCHAKYEARIADLEDKVEEYKVAALAAQPVKCYACVDQETCQIADYATAPETFGCSLGRRS